MGWRERLQPASFRGVPFEVDAAEATGGRRLARHEYPLRNEPYTEDLGRKARSWTITAFLIGEEYDVGRNRLLRACEADGPGTLVHPYLGELRVLVESVLEKETKQEGRVARLSLTFVEAGRLGLAEGQSVDTSRRVRARAVAAVAQIKVVGASSVVVANRPDAVQSATTSKFASVLDMIEVTP